MNFPSIDPRQIVILNLTETVDQRYRHSFDKEEAKRYLGICIQKILKKKSVAEPIHHSVDHYLDRIAYSIKKHALIRQSEKELLQLNFLKQTAQFDTLSFQPHALTDQEEKEGGSSHIRDEIKTTNTESCRLLSRSAQAKKEKEKEVRALENTLLSINPEQKEWEKKVAEELIRTKEWERKCEEEQNVTVKKIHILNQSIDAAIHRIEKEPDRLKKEYDALKETWEKEVEKSCNQFERERAVPLKEQQEKIASLLKSYTEKRHQAIEGLEKQKKEKIKAYRSAKNQSQLDYEQRCHEIRREYDDLMFKPTLSRSMDPRISLADPDVNTLNQELKERQILPSKMRELEGKEKKLAANEAEQTKTNYELKKNEQVNWLEKEETRYFQPKIHDIREVFIKKILKDLGR